MEKALEILKSLSYDCDSGEERLYAEHHITIKKVKEAIAELNAKNKRIKELEETLNSAFVRNVQGWQPIGGSIKNPTPPKKC